MSSFVIEGRRALHGKIAVAGNKNAALPMLAATLLTGDPVALTKVPKIRDVEVMLSILQDLGVAVSQQGSHGHRLTASKLKGPAPSPQLCSQIRASFLLAGPLLARLGRAELPAPGGDRIGRRPIDSHLAAFARLGATVEILPDRYVLTAPRGLTGADIFLEEMSVTATENAVMAASLASGTTILRNSASEPHVQDLCRLLVAMGGSIHGIGTNTLLVEGQKSLHGASAEVGPDNVEVGSLIALAAVTGGEILIEGARPEEHHQTALVFGRLGVRFEVRGADIFVPAKQELVIQDGVHGALPNLHDAPWPGFPADLTSIALVLATQAHGTILIHEWMYESRLYWVDRLISMGARVIVCDPHRAVVVGPSRLYGKVISSPDIRAGMALVIAALCAEGKSTIHNAQQIDRGYEALETRLAALGASIERVDSRQS